MPYKSEAQRKYMHAMHPEVAQKWDAEEKMSKMKKRPYHKLAKAAEKEMFRSKR